MPDLRHALPAVEAGLELLRAPLTSYQITGAAALGEPNADLTGYRYPIVCILWPRQTGKTTLLLCLAFCPHTQQLRAAHGPLCCL